MPTNPLTHHIDVQYVVPAEGLPGEDDFEAWSRVALAGRRDGAELCVRIVSREESAQLNRRYRHKTGATNVLSFPADLPDYVEDPYLGDLVICAEVVAEEAHEQGKNPMHHWAHMFIHGVLHLLGYDHQDDAQARVMEALEVELLAHMGLSNPYLLQAE